MRDGLAQNRAPVVDLGHIPSLYIHRHHASNPIVFFRYSVLIHSILRTIRRNCIFRRSLPVAGVQVHLSEQRVTGVLALQQGANRKVAKKAVQEPPAGIGVDTFEFWIPERRPGGQNLALTCDPPLALFGPEQVTRGPARPTTQPNAWVAAVDDPAPTLTLDWAQPQTLARIVLSFDTDFDHAMESVQWGHPERAMPFCVKSYVLRSGDGSVLAEVTDNHQTRNVITFSQPIATQWLTLASRATHGAPAAVFRVACYGD